MKKIIVVTLGLCLLTGCSTTLLPWPTSPDQPTTSTNPIPSKPPKASPPEKVTLDVPFIPEVVNNNWSKPWNNACEEASVAMVEYFYRGTQPANRAEEEKLILKLVAWENKEFGYNANTNAAETARLINETTSFKATVQQNPTLAAIKAELAAGRPVISLHYGFGLNNPELNFVPTGSSYHMMVLVGFDEQKQEFIVNDNGWEGGLDSRYPYATILDTLRDYSHTTKKTSGVPTVLFTSPKGE